MDDTGDQGQKGEGRDWVVRLLGTDPAEYLSTTGTWDTIATAAWFDSESAANIAAERAARPEGTSAVAVRLPPAAH